jgi:Holliday junction resolvase RusA-like endonuclease
MRLDFFIPGEPPTVTAQEKGLATRQIWRGGKLKTVPFAYETPEVKRIRELFVWQLGAHRPERELDGPIRMITIWTWQATKTHKPGTYRDTKPDTDNIVKAVMDALNGAAYHDDSQVTTLHVYKRYGIAPCVKVWISKEDI